MLKQVVVFATIGCSLLLFSCRKKDLEEGNLNPECKIEHMELEGGRRLSNETGRIVRIGPTGAQSRVRIHMSNSDNYLDPCNLPSDIPVGSKVRYSGIWYKVKNTENVNMDYFPLGLSKIEVID